MALKELERLNGTEVFGFKIFIDLEGIKAMIPKRPCDCFECWKIKTGFLPNIPL